MERMNRDTLKRLSEAKRSREISRFFSFQRRVSMLGGKLRDEAFWRREEAQLFEAEHVSAGEHFEEVYDTASVERRGGDCEGPVESLQELCERFQPPPLLMANFDRCGYKTLTPVQRHSMPAACGGADVMVSAQAGSGKTMAFLLPILRALLGMGERPSRLGPVQPVAVVFSPTRELCQQIAVEARRLCFRSSCHIVALHGGEDAVPQLDQLAEGCDLAVCSPGRLSDFVRRGVIELGEVRILVLDEADRMLDMGFEDQIRSLVSLMPPNDKRQTLMFSATMPDTMELTDLLRTDHCWLNVDSLSSPVEQRFEDVKGADRFQQLLVTLSEVPGKALVFCNRISNVRYVTAVLCEHGIRAQSIHGELAQHCRDQNILFMRLGRVDVLVATDVAARGLDIPGVDHVINFELSTNLDDHLHRIGRTGRIGNAGVATSFVGEWEPGLRSIVSSMRQAGEPMPEWLPEVAIRRKPVELEKWYLAMEEKYDGPRLREDEGWSPPDDVWREDQLWENRW